MEYDTFMDFLSDKEGDFSEARCLALAEKLYREGRNKNDIAVAMLEVAFALLIESETAERAIGILEDKRDRYEKLRHDIRTVLDSARERNLERERQQEAGGCSA